MFQILVVEDDKELRDLFCTVLSENGYISIPASDALSAFDVLEHKYIDLIISDVMMPKMDGFEMIRSLREGQYTLPILIITAKESATDKREGFLAGTDDYMVKPIDLNEMLWRVEALLRRSQIISQRKQRLEILNLTATRLPCIPKPKSLSFPKKNFSFCSSWCPLRTGFSLAVRSWMKFGDWIMRRIPIRWMFTLAV